MQPIRTLLAALLFAACALPAFAQTIKTLGFNLTNNTVVGPTNTNALTFTNAVSFAGQIQSATGTASQPGLRVSTNSGTGLYYGSALGIGGFVAIARDSNSIARFATNRAIFDQPIDFISPTNDAARQTRTNLGLGATWLTNTSVTNFRTAIGLGATNSVSFQRLDIASDPTNTTNFTLATFTNSYTGFGLSILATDEDLSAGYDAPSGSIGVGAEVFQVKYSSNINDWGWPILTKDNGSNLAIVSPSTTSYLASYHFEFNRPLAFANTTNAAITRTNLGLPLAALTNNSNVTTMRALAGSTDTNEPYSGTVPLTNTNVLTFSNGILLRIQ